MHCQLSVAGLGNVGVARGTGNGGTRLFLSESWIDDAERMARAGVQKDRQTALTKPEDGDRRDRLHHRIQCAFWLCSCRFRIRPLWALLSGFEQTHQQLKQELGLGHFEGMSWTRLHRNALMITIACAVFYPAASKQQNKKESGDRRYNRACRP